MIPPRKEKMKKSQKNSEIKNDKVSVYLIRTESKNVVPILLEKKRWGSNIIGI